MSDALPEFEVVNSVGSSQTIEGTTEATTGAIKALPAIADKFIESFTIENLSPIDDGQDEPNINIHSELLVSVNNGATFIKLLAGYELTLTPKQTKQIIVKGNVPNVPYIFNANYEVFI